MKIFIKEKYYKLALEYLQNNGYKWIDGKNVSIASLQDNSHIIICGKFLLSCGTDRENCHGCNLQDKCMDIILYKRHVENLKNITFNEFEKSKEGETIQFEVLLRESKLKRLL